MWQVCVSNRHLFHCFQAFPTCVRGADFIPLICSAHLVCRCFSVSRFNMKVEGNLFSLYTGELGLFFFYVDTTGRHLKSLLILITKEGPGPFFSLSSSCNSPCNAAIQAVIRVYGEIWPWRCWNSPWCSWNHSWIRLAVCIRALPSLNILGEQCIKSAPGPAEALHISWRLHQDEEVTPDLMPGMRWLQIHHAAITLFPSFWGYRVVRHCVLTLDIGL